jgi:hypothetical protein
MNPTRYESSVHVVPWLCWPQQPAEVNLLAWLYSYHQPSANGGMVHYIAVNGRTGETMGSIPIQQWKLLLAAHTTGTFIEAAVLIFLGMQ